jgi:chromosome partitioning protein
MRSIALLSEKGGSGKTTSTLNIAAGLAALGERVLVIDTDPQSNATLVLTQSRKPNAPTLCHVLLATAPLADAIVRTHWEGVDLLPAEPALAEVNVQLAAELGRERRLRAALAECISEKYTFVLVDCSPQRTLINVNVMNAVHEIIVPVDPGLFSLSGLGQLQEAAGQVQRFLDNQGLKISGLLLTRLRKDNVCRAVETELRQLFGPLVLEASIPHAVKVEEAHSRFESVLTYSPRCAAAKAYIAIVEEIQHGKANRVGDADCGALEADCAA